MAWLMTADPVAAPVTVTACGVLQLPVPKTSVPGENVAFVASLLARVTVTLPLLAKRLGDAASTRV